MALAKCQICGAGGFRRLAVHMNKSHGILSMTPEAIAQRARNRPTKPKSWATEKGGRHTGPLHTWTREEILAARAADNVEVAYPTRTVVSQVHHAGNGA